MGILEIEGNISGGLEKETIKLMVSLSNFAHLSISILLRHLSEGGGVN